MKIPQLFLKRPLVLLLAASLIFPSLPGTAQNGIVPPPPGYGTPPASPAPIKINLEIKDRFIVTSKGENGHLPATIKNLSDYLRSLNPELNIVYPPGVGEVVLDDLKLHATDLPTAFQAITVASQFKVRSDRLGENTWALATSNSRQPAQTSIEVFNLGSYLAKLGIHFDSLKTLLSVKMEAEARHASTKTLLEQLRQLPPEALRQALVTTGRPDAILSQMLQDYAACEAKLQTLKSELREDHPDVVRAVKTLKDLDAKIDGRVKGILFGMEAEMASSQATVSYAELQATQGKANADQDTAIATKAVDEIGKLIKDAVMALSQQQRVDTGSGGFGGKGNPAREDDQPYLKFHAGTGLLVVVGTPQALEAARKVVAALSVPEINPPPPGDRSTPMHPAN